MSQPFPFFLDFYLHNESLAVKEELERLVLQMYKSGLRYSEAVRELQRTFLATVLRAENANQVRVARRLGIHRNTLHRQILELGLDPKALRMAHRRPPSSERTIVGQKSYANYDRTRH